MGRQPTYEQYAQIMTGYTPEQMPVISALARGFATFDHWFCEVPSQTFTNRSFFHAGTASGFVVNVPVRVLPDAQHRRDPVRAAGGQGFDLARLLRPAEPGVVHRPDPRARGCATASRPTSSPPTTSSRTPRRGAPADLLVHRAEPVARPQRHAPADLRASTAWRSTRHRRFWVARRCWRGSTTRSAPRRPPSGSNCSQHAADGRLRRARRHLRPRPAAAGDAARPGGAGRADGVQVRSARGRFPAIAISPWIPERTVVNDVYRHTSVIRTLRKRWSLGAPSQRGTRSPRTSPRSCRPDQPRAPDKWPDVVTQPVPAFDAAADPARRAARPARPEPSATGFWRSARNSHNPPPISAQMRHHQAPRHSPSCATSSLTCSRTCRPRHDRDRDHSERPEAGHCSTRSGLRSAISSARSSEPSRTSRTRPRSGGGSSPSCWARSSSSSSRPAAG